MSPSLPIDLDTTSETIPRRRQLRLVGTDVAAPVMDGVRVAFASTDRSTVNQHFGATEAFAIFEIGPGSSQLVEVTEFLDTAQDGNENKLPAKIATLSGCAAVYCLAVGASAVKQLLASGVQPIRVEEGACIDRLIGDLQGELASGPGGWLAKAVKARQPADSSRFDAMEAEGWQE
ncbi:nitrogen fixation protein NifX [Azoarcus sp. TTM-91]|uniref:NifB/NifX family molybdenum-iron cluster-binding protein n=1 Tax=Azoarcus sp. TTM-91 TaxID=2691581 RepID=UPI00145C6644|nr:NifB/NifX family molybdenum-iron cluster-binding protein [Azoarcus sp. TTM-91]NMG34351.1 nitrogen fixation protein NifX [Azoarcus sp. TTM-91]